MVRAKHNYESFEVTVLRKVLKQLHRILSDMQIKTTEVYKGMKQTNGAFTWVKTAATVANVAAQCDIGKAHLYVK